MPVAAYVLLSAVALLIVLAVLIRSRASGRRLSASSEPQEPHDAAVDPMDVAFKALLHETPDDCLVHSLLAEWTEGKPCALCNKELSAQPDLHGHGPALLSPDRVTFEWTDLRAEDLPQVFASHQPICWDCHIIETLYRMHPDLITEREPHKPSRA